MSRAEVLAAVEALGAKKDFVWDGMEEDERPATDKELYAVIASSTNKPGRPPGSRKTQIALRVDNDVLAAFRASGPGWQTRINAALRDWLKSHSPA